jgi:hypothetical protein
MPGRNTDIAAAICALVFVAVLAIAGYVDASIRVLHVFESVPYLLASALFRSKIGYAVGLASGAFWLWTAGFLTTFIRNGFQRLDVLIHGGAIDRPDILLSVPAAAATAGLALFSIAGYARRSDKSWSDLLIFGIAAVAVPAYFVGIFVVFAPQYLGMFRRLMPR